MTSREAVDCVLWVAGRVAGAKRSVPQHPANLQPLKAGHAGTLDPLASGVLVVCVGAATRLVEYVHRMTKHYAAAFLLGRQSPTEDVSGNVTELPSPPIPTLQQIAAAGAALTGPIQQRPPAFSAIKVKGRRAYELARRGKPLQLEPRTVMVHRLEVESYNYPELRLRVECGPGTYVRSLGRDLAESLGTAAVMSQLVRTAVGDFRIEDAADPATLTRENWTDCLLPPLRAVEMLPRIALSETELARVRSGQSIERSDLPPGNEPAEIAAIDPEGRLAAILTSRGPGLWGPVHNLPAGNDQGTRSNDQ